MQTALDAEKRVNALAMQLGKYIIDTYLKRRKDSGAVKQTFKVEVYEQAGQIKIDIDK